jgi:hypothetical protein
MTISLPIKGFLILLINRNRDGTLVTKIDLCTSMVNMKNGGL